MKESFVIEGFEKLTQQEIFDKAAHHILSTGVKSVDGDGSCVYNGTGCAAAVFIKPELRDKVSGVWPPKWTGTRPVASSKCHGYELPTHEAELIRSIQLCHDGSRNSNLFLEDFKKQMHKVAIRYNLDTKALN